MRLALAYAACALLLLVGPAGWAGAADRTATLHVVERATTDATAHIGPGADNAGDILTFANDVYDAADAVKIGTDQGYCIRLVPGKSFECHWTLFLKDGQITVDGPFFDAADSVLAVTGGTGAYAAIRGEMTLHARDAKGAEYDFTYRLRGALDPAGKNP